MEDQFVFHAQKRGQNVRYLTKAKEITSTSYKSEKLILISDSHFEILDIEKHDSIRSHSWFFLTKIKCTNKDTLFLRFDKTKISIVCEDLPKIMDVISDILPRILKKSELESTEFLATISPLPKPTPVSCLLRVEEKSKLSGVRVPLGSISYLKKVLTFSESHLRLSELTDPKTSIPILLDVLPLCHKVTSITIPNITRVDPYQMVSAFVAESSSVQHIEVEGSISKVLYFEKFLKNIEANDEIPIIGLTFSDTKLTAKNLETLSNTVRNKGIRCLGFRNAITEIDTFYTAFISKNIGSYMSILTLDKIPNININLILKSCPNLEFLSIVNCRIDIVEAVTQLQGKNLPLLRGINLSGNFCGKSGPRNMKLPPLLQSISVNNISWASRTLSEFIQTITHSVKKGLHLSIADADASTEEFVRVFNYFRQTRFTHLHSFVWSSNPIHPRLFDFFSRNPELIHIDLSYCFNNSEKEAITAFAQYIINSNSLKSLILKGNPLISNPPDIALIIKAVEVVKSVQYLDISNNKIGDDGLEMLKSLLSNAISLRVLNFDGSEPKKASSLFSLLTFSTHSPTNAAVSYPSSDIDSLLKQNKISQEDVDTIRSKLMYCPNYSNSPFDRPYLLFQDEPTASFPVFAKSSDIKSLFESHVADYNDRDEENYTLDIIDAYPEAHEVKYNKIPPNSVLQSELDVKQNRSKISGSAQKQKSFRIENNQASDKSLPEKQDVYSHDFYIKKFEMDEQGSNSIETGKLTEDKLKTMEVNNVKRKKRRKLKKSYDNYTSFSADSTLSTMQSESITLNRTSKLTSDSTNIVNTSTDVDPSNMTSEMYTLEGSQIIVDNDSEPPTMQSMIEYNTKDERYQKTTVKDDRLFDFPIKIDLFGRVNHEWRKSERRYNIENLHSMIHNIKPEKGR